MAASSIVDNYATVVLAYGQRDNLTIDHIMTTKSPLNLGFYQWIIPTTVEPRTDYVIEVGTDASNIAFAGRRQKYLQLALHLAQHIEL